ncbi:hypothetical protein V865_006250 [Kwoniella europaea PYCC6329]|uniref:Uncharacterized protein n=1 Tax=Kwoniella europaea PYCC6329 TaxID=1423913 RepID=A0AAX4KQA9_9TREE
MSNTSNATTDKVPLTKPLSNMTLQPTSEIPTSVPSVTSEHPKPDAISNTVGQDDVTVTVADTIPSTNGDNKSKPIFMRTTYLFEGMKKTDEWPGIEWLARLTWDEKYEPSQDVKDSAQKFDYGYLVPQLRNFAGTSVDFSMKSDYSKGSTWTEVTKRFKDQMRERGERASHAAWEAFKRAHPDESENFEIKYVSQEEYANAHPHPSGEHPFPTYKWGNKGIFDFDKHTTEVDEFYADGSEQSKGIVLTAGFVKKGAYIDRRLGSSAENQDTGVSGDSDAPVTEDVIVMPETEAAIRLASLPGCTISQQNKEKSLLFIAQMKERLTSVTQDKSHIVVDRSQGPKDRVYAITANHVISISDRSSEVVQAAFNEDRSNVNHFTYLHLSPDNYEAFGNNVKISRVSYEDYWNWAKKSNGYGNDGPEGTGEEVSVV